MKYQLPKRAESFSMDNVKDCYKIERVNRKYVGLKIKNKFAGRESFTISKVYRIKQDLVVDAFDKQGRSRTFYAQDCKLIKRIPR
jgi:hypothetical protein